MGFINVAERTINAKLVYYGVGVGGKTTSLQQVHGILCPRNEVQLVSINTEEDSTLLFDFLPINLGQVGGFKIRIQGFTVPGQPKYRQMRKYVLQGARAVEATFGFDYVRGISIGLLLAAAGGLGSLLFGLPFLTSGHVDLHLPVIGSLPLASALVFDTGVYVVVFAGALLILSTMGTVRRRTLAAEEAA